MPRGKKRCPSCNVFVGVRSSSCDCGFKFQKPTKKQEVKNKKPPKLKINKKEILIRLVEVPNTEKRFFYAREMKMLNDLCNRYSLEFMNIVNFDKKFDSLAYLVSPKLRNVLDQKFRAFNYVVDKTRYPTYTIGDKCGDDKKIAKKMKTTKDFLDER
tara:strand:- start:292 stop:762 length:471 start_codon:yes stop_codon:yes gene_type:complete